MIKKMKKKIITALLLAAFSANGSVLAAETVDFSADINELKSLIAECNALGISTDYESMTCAVLEKYSVLINNDLKNDYKYANTSLGFMYEMFDDTKAKLQSYIDGEATPLEGAVTYDSFDVTANGTSLYSDGRPFYSIGVGHFQAARNDIPYFPAMGITNIQTELGVTKLNADTLGWALRIKNADYSVEKKTVSGGDRLTLKNNVAYDGASRVVFTKYVECKPNTKYKFGLKIRGENSSDNSFWFSAEGPDSGRYYVGKNKLTSTRFNEFSVEHTTTADQTQLYLSFGSYDTADVQLADFYLYELDSNGNTVGENIVVTGEAHLKSLTDALENAEKNNVGVCLLLSPHYFPTGLDESVYATGSGIGYNINAPQAKTVIENYLRMLMPIVKDYKALTSICLSNEPTFNTRAFPDFYNPLFREYLQSVHGDIETLNSRYGASYSSFDEISMPSDLTSGDPVCYDWIEFNDRTFTDWHKWMADIIKEYVPDMPLHAKILGNYFPDGKDIKDSDRGVLGRGVDLEMFDEFSDYAGNDALDWFGRQNFYYSMMFLYDYQHSVTNKPVYDTEEHMIGDREGNFNAQMRRHVRNNLWQGAIHGRNLSSVWTWDKDYSTAGDNSLYAGIGFRPDAAAELGRTSLDLSRLAYDVDELNRNEERTAIFYSKPTRLYSDTYTYNLRETYKALLNMGEKVGVVSDKSVGKLSGYDVLIIPGAENAMPETLTAINSFISGGGKVIYTGDVLAKDEYNRPADNSLIKSKGHTYSVSSAATDLKKLYKSFDMTEIELLDENGGELSGLDWQYSIKDGRLLINVTNVYKDEDKKAYVYANGERLSDMENLLTGEKGIELVELAGETPALLSAKMKLSLNDDIENLSADGKKLSWTYRKGSGKAYIYAYSEDGTRSMIGKTSGNEYTVTDAGTYFVRTAGGKNINGTSITVTDDMPLVLAVNSCMAWTSSCRAEVETENTGDVMCTGAIIIEACDENGERVGYTVCKTTLDGGESTCVKALFATDKKADHIRAYALDGEVSKKALSEVATNRTEATTEATAE